jgi:hypothetical protein
VSFTDKKISMKACMSLVGIDASSPVLRSPRLELVPRRQQFATWYASAERELMEDERLEDELLLEDRRLEDELLLQGELRPGGSLPASAPAVSPGPSASSPSTPAV